MWKRTREKIAAWQNPPASSNELILDRHRVYIFPNRIGLVYAILLLAIFITSVNYNLNLGFALDFVLVSCGWFGVNFTYRNLSGLGLNATTSQPVFVGELAHFALLLNNRARYVRYALYAGFSNTTMQAIDITAASTASISLSAKAERRGWMACPRIRIQTTFPYGLLTAWSYWNTTQTVLVYPQPESNPPPLPFHEEGRSGSFMSVGSDEFSGVRNYQIGDPLKLLAWRQMARQSTDDHQVLLSKHFEGGLQQVCTLDFDALSNNLGLEQKISRLCAWLLTAEAQHISYAFKLGGLQYRRNSGEDHLNACLLALALYQQDSGRQT